MTYILSVISNPEEAAIDDETASKIAKNVGQKSDDTIWLNQNIACEFKVEKDCREEALSAIGDKPIDLALTPAEHRRKLLLVADMDSTMIEQECIDEMAAVMGLREKISAITEIAMRGEMDFEQAMRERVMLVKGASLNQLERIADEKVTLTPGARQLVQTMRQHGAYCALLSGGFTIFTSKVAQRIGFDMHQSNILNFENGVLDGTIEPPFFTAESKVYWLERLTKEKSVSEKLTMAVGDGANDLAMINKASLGVAFRAKPIVAKSSDVKIQHGDLTSLLYIQGYSSKEFTL